MTRYLTAALFLAACAVQPTTSRTSDPVRCQNCGNTGVTYDQADSTTLNWVHANYPTALGIDDAGCNSDGAGTWACGVAFEAFGVHVMIGCTVYADGSSICYEVDDA